MNDLPGKDALAQLHGFDSFAKLKEAATPLLTSDGKKWYVSVDPRGRWFVWDDEAVPESVCPPESESVGETPTKCCRHDETIA